MTQLSRLERCLPSLLLPIILLLGLASRTERFAHNIPFVELNRALANEQPLTYLPEVARLFRNIHEESPSSMYGLAYAMERQNRHNEALVSWRTHPNGEQLLEEWGRVSYKAKNYADALQWYMQLTTLNSGLADGWYYAGRSSELLGDETNAEILFSKGLKSQEFAQVTERDFYARLAHLKLQNEPSDLEAVLKLSEQALAGAGPSDSYLTADAHYTRAEVLVRLGEPRRAIYEYQAAIDHYPELYFAYVNLSSLVWQELGDGARAEKLLAKAVELTADNPSAFIALGKLYADTNRLEEAIQMYCESLRLDPTNQYVQEDLKQLRQLSELSEP